MPKITIDKKTVEVAEGTTVLQAGRSLGIDIPALCHDEKVPGCTSCFVCVVRVDGQEKLVPSCATVCREGMVVESETDEVRQARRVSLELLLGEHLGDCVAPCELACPAGMNIPLMIRQISEGHFGQAVMTVKDRIPLASVLGRICPAPCEKACRRGRIDGPVAICLLKRYAADWDLRSDSPYLPACKPATGKKVALIGAGPAGLSCAWYLLQEGISCTIFDDHRLAGGMLRYGILEEQLGYGVLVSEISLIEKLGATFFMGQKVSPGELRNEYDAVVVCVGDGTGWEMEIDPKTLQVGSGPVFAAGDFVRPSRMAVRAVAQGRIAAGSVIQYLNGQPVVAEERPFSTHYGRLEKEQMKPLLSLADDSKRLEMASDSAEGFDQSQAVGQARRCLHCDCRKLDSCKLREYSRKYHADPRNYAGPKPEFELITDHPAILFEPGKCIRCGLCIRATEQNPQLYGLTFIGRGADVRIGPSLDRPLSQAVSRYVKELCELCPTGALSLK